MSTIAQELSKPASAERVAAPARPRRKSIDEWSDQEAGYAAAIVVGALGLVLLAIIAGIMVYATSWGYWAGA